MLKNLLNRRSESPDKRQEQELMQEYFRLTDRLDQIRTNYDFVSDDAEIDALIYEENAVLRRIAALFQRAREMGAHIDFPDSRRGR